MAETEKKKTILFYINTIGYPGGAERVIINLARQFLEIGYDCMLCTSTLCEQEYSVPDGVQRFIIEEEKIKQSAFKRNLKRIQYLRRLCKRFSPDYMVTFMEEANIRGIIATRGLPIKLIISCRNDPQTTFSSLTMKFIGKVLYRFASSMVCQTEEAQNWFPINIQKKSKVILNAVDNRFFEANYRGFENISPVIVSLGRLEQQKRFDVLLLAFKRLLAKNPSPILYIYGTGSQKFELSEMIKTLELTGKVFLKGATDSVISVLENASVFVLSSDYEGMPNALLEALAVGVPSVSTDCPCGGPRSIIQNEKNGLLVPVGNDEVLANAIYRILEDREFAKKLSDNAIKMSKIFSPDCVFEHWRNFIEGC